MTIDQSARAPVTKEAVVANLGDILAEALRMDRDEIGVHRPLHQLGASSVIVVEVLRSIHEMYGVRPAPRRVFQEFFTLDRLSGYVIDLIALKQRRDESKVAALSRKPTQETTSSRFSLTAAQERLWFLSQYSEAASLACNERALITLSGQVDLEALRAAVHDVVERHEALRVRISRDEPAQEIAPIAPFELPIEDLSAHEGPALTEAVASWLAHEAQRPFALDVSPFRVTVLRLRADLHMLATTAHGIVVDRRALHQVLLDLGSLYSARKGNAQGQLEEPASFRDHIDALAARAKTPRAEASRAYWAEQYKDGIPTLDLPSDRPRPPAKSFRGARVTLPLETDLVASLSALSARHGVTLDATLLAAFSVFISRLTGEDDFAIGVDCQERSEAHDAKPLVAPTSNVLPIRARVPLGGEFHEHVVAVDRRLKEGLDHADYPFASVVRSLAPRRDESRSPVFIVAFGVEPTWQAPQLHGLKAAFVNAPVQYTKYDLHLTFLPRGGSAELVCDFCSDMFERPMVSGLMAHFRALLDGIASAPDATLLAVKQLVPESMIPATRVDPVPASAQRPLRLQKYVAPRSEVEADLAALWARLLGQAQVGIHDDFFALGGHSILLTALATHVRKQYDIDVGLRELFDVATVATLAAWVERKRAERRACDGQNARQRFEFLDREAALDPEIHPGALVYTPVEAPRTVLLTGATGFVGAYLLRELLDRTELTVHCLVRGANPEDARRRIDENLKRWRVYKPGYSRRIVPVIGDLAEVRFGLGEDDWKRLGSGLDLIVHSGAMVKFLSSYDELKPANVGGTREIIRLAFEGKIKPVHHISTAGVFPLRSNAIIAEASSIDHNVLLNLAYQETKWVCEKMLGRAQARGLPVAIYRVGEVCGDLATGQSVTEHAFFAFLKGCVQLKLFPQIDGYIDMSPVDYLARSVVHLAPRHDSAGKTFHLSNPKPLHVSQMVDWLRAQGYELGLCTFDEWRNAVMSETHRGTNAFAPYIDLFDDWTDANAAFTTFDSAETRRALEGTGIACHPVDEALLARVFGYMTAGGFFPKPEARLLACG